MDDSDIGLCKEAIIYVSDVITSLIDKLNAQDVEMSKMTEKITELNGKVKELINVNNRMYGNGNGNGNVKEEKEENVAESHASPTVLTLDLEKEKKSLIVKKHEKMKKNIQTNKNKIVNRRKRVI